MWKLNLKILHLKVFTPPEIYLIENLFVVYIQEKILHFNTVCGQKYDETRSKTPLILVLFLFSSIHLVNVLYLFLFFFCLSILSCQNIFCCDVCVCMYVLRTRIKSAEFELSHPISLFYYIFEIKSKHDKFSNAQDLLKQDKETIQMFQLLYLAVVAISFLFSCWFTVQPFHKKFVFFFGLISIDNYKIIGIEIVLWKRWQAQYDTLHSSKR